MREVFLKSKLGNAYFDFSKNVFDIKMQKCMAFSSGGGSTTVLLYVTTTILNEWQIVQDFFGKWQSEVRASTAWKLPRRKYPLNMLLLQFSGLDRKFSICFFYFDFASKYPLLCTVSSNNPVLFFLLPLSSCSKWCSTLCSLISITYQMPSSLGENMSVFSRGNLKAGFIHS